MAIDQSAKIATIKTMCHFSPAFLSLSSLWPTVKKAILLHEGQLRQSGEQYVCHCFRVADILYSWGITDNVVLRAALLHDAVEDAGLKVDEIKKDHGEELAFLVDGLSKMPTIANKTEADMLTLRKILSRSFTDPRVAVIKLADRLHNMETLGSLEPERQYRKAWETMQVYVCLAESLGMWLVKNKLEDLCFFYLDPNGFRRSRKEIDADPRRQARFIDAIAVTLREVMKKAKLAGRIEVRKNGYWNLSKKRSRAALRGKSSPFSYHLINDVVSFRVLLDSVENCYRYLYRVHQIWSDAVDYSRFDEFMFNNVAPNNYSALQTTLSLPQGAVEIAITTQQKEDFNNWGIVSMMRKKKSDLSRFALKVVFTPSGEARFLPRNATGVDFAYLINPRLGAEARYLLSDGKKTVLTRKIKNSASLEVACGPARRAPPAYFLEHCLPSTQKIISEQLIAEQKDKLTSRGKKMMEKMLSSRGLLVLTDIEGTTNFLYRFGCQNIEDLYFKVGGGYITKEILKQALDDFGIDKEKLGITTIRVSGDDQPGILKTITGLVADLGGNIGVVESRPKRKKFHIRITVRNLNQKKEKLIRDFLALNPIFENYCVV